MLSGCEETVKLYDIEGYAQAGFVRNAKYISCGKSKVKILLQLINNKVVCSPCLDQQVAELSKRVIELYRVVELQR
ncbi:MAG: hypothetical protein LM572_00165 [Ignisphaera sp.]|jgi:hypothetical protein|nr:hypothetical protein [Ignisphaera sp.]MCC6056337.1 hypothetical protein [Desulfurococcaceae archaeon]